MIHPRPSPIAAALYTLRDLEVDVIIMHGPADVVLEQDACLKMMEYM